MTNPNNAVGTNGAFGGRTSVNAFNDIMGAFQSRGVLSGWGISPSSGMTVSVGGNGTTRDVAVAEDASGNKTSVNNISGAPILVTLDSAPASNSRYDAIVAYVDKPPVSSATQDNPECCGIIPVTGTSSSSPAYPDDNTIRSAITADGASGATAYYAILGYVLVASGTTSITSAMITGGLSPTTNAMVDTAHIQDSAVTSSKIDWATTVTSVSIGDYISTTAAFTASGQVVKMGKLLFGQILLARSSGTFGDFVSQVGTVATAYRPKNGIVTYAVAFTDSSDTSSGTPCYARIVGNTGVFSLSGYGTGGNKTVARFSFIYEIN